MPECPADVIARSDATLRKLQESDDMKAQREIADALLWKGLSLEELERDDDAVRCYDAIIERWGDGASSDSALRRTLIFALYNKAQTHARNRRPDDAMEVLAELLNRHAFTAPADVKYLLHRGLMLAGNIAAEHGRYETAIQFYDKLADLYGQDNEAVMASARVSKARTLLVSEKWDEALKVYDELLTLLGDVAAESDLDAMLAQTLYGRACTLEELGRRADAGWCYNELLARFGDYDDPVVAERVGRARRRLKALNRG